MPPAKKRKNQNNSSPAAKRKTTNDKKLEKLLISKSWKETVKCLKTKTGKKEAERSRFLRLALEQKAPINVIRALLEARPKEACQLDKDGRLPLHAIISGTGSISQRRSLVVETLLDAYPKAAQQCDENGLFPLHHACATKAFSKIVEKILKLYPDGANQAATYRVGLLPMSHFPFEGWLPLHVACCKISNIDLINMLVNANPQALQKRTSRADRFDSDLGHQVSTLAYYNYVKPKELESFASLSPFQWSFKTAIYSHRTYQKFSAETKSVLVFLLTMTYPDICAVERDRFYEQRAKCFRNQAGKGTNKNTYSDNSFLLLHYALYCFAPLDVIKTISGKKLILLERNKDDKLPIHCALDTGNVPAAIYLIHRYYEIHAEGLPFLVRDIKKEWCWTLHVDLAKCSLYDDRRNRLLHSIFELNHVSAEILFELDNGNHKSNCPLHVYLVKMMTTPDADPQQGCGGVVTICPLVVREFMHGCPSSVGTPLRIQRMRTGYKLLVAKIADGVPLYPFQILCMLFSDMFISNINFSGSQDDNTAFWEESNLSYTNNILMRRKFDEDSKVDQGRLESDIVVVDVLFNMLQLYPAAIASN